MNQLKKSNFEKFPSIEVKGHKCIEGWESITDKITALNNHYPGKKFLVVVECYPGVYVNEIATAIQQYIPAAKVYDVSQAMKPGDEIEKMVYPFVTDDPVFGYMAPLNLGDFFDAKKVRSLQDEIKNTVNGPAFPAGRQISIILGLGASIICPAPDFLFYADMPRWEIQLRFRQNTISNIGAQNPQSEFSYLYKRSFFVDWRVCDRHKKRIMNDWDFVLDTTIPDTPKLISGTAIREAWEEAISRPFRTVPFFDPGPWGGQWLKEVCDLDRDTQNFAWGFDCVPEENSLLFSFDGILFESPAINLVFAKPEKLLGMKVFDAFGTEFPIRFDFLDTMEGGNLSLQVHPLREYIKEKFGMPYTQDESYYIMDAKDDAYVYLGLKEKVVPEKMVHQLEEAQENGDDFNAEEFVQKWHVKKHDHILIPAGTVHCSGADTVVLEISATPYIFTFKLWDWGRMGLDGKPRPISIEHGKEVIQWNRTANWTKENIINRIGKVNEGDGWLEEKTGLDPSSFIETRRHWFSKKVVHHTNGVFAVLNLIKGREAIVESPSGSFEPFVIHYAETFIVPAAVGEYSIRPYGESEGAECATIKAFVRTENLIDYRIN
ncbi:mannose-6-phosphate isomerase [Hanamia caeni]|uniref:Mannose-6-phosphate isomerase n=1 Tax=Hanamia caeni TaxID=2294116 RepID=A0A3M9NLX1_9BACT|nr:class I mannose-6-phosphate isomerase [Hanamia caeni]RNI38782.1 mannose-6-phosphate isomerase [Hanamia caeni]